MSTITPEQKKEFSECYKLYAQIKDETTEMNDSVKDAIKLLSKKMECKPAILNKTFAHLYAVNNTGENVLEEVNQILSEVREV